jgi:uncharacterized membrane protein YciS (DUF1049 family)
MSTAFIICLAIGIVLRTIYYFSPRQQLNRRMRRERKTMDEIFDNEQLPY